MELYTFLLGPFLRRTEPSRVCVWFATSIRPKLCEATVYSLHKEKGGKQWIEQVFFTNTKYNVIQLGAKLFIILLEITPTGNEGLFKPLSIYGYDVFFLFNDADKVILNEKDITSKDGALKAIPFTKTFNNRKNYTYADLPYPVFVIPERDNINARIIYGSCRKTHGRGSDALNAADMMLEDLWKTYSAQTVRVPRIPDFSLFLLGDQIYADDLNELVFDSIQDLSLSIMGYEESISEYANIPELTTKDLTKYLYSYWDGVPGHKIEDLNFPTQISFKDSSVPGNRRKNIRIFLEKYFINLTESSPREVDRIIDSRVPDLIDRLRRLPSQWPPLIDVNELMTREYLTAGLSPHRVKVKGIKYKERRDFLRRNSSITTDDHGHLLSFGEFAALYLLNWGNFFLLRNDFDTQVKMATVSEHFGTAVPDEYKDNLEGLLNGNPQIRRLFANVPTYMIFDDHEVTDEWNCDEIWRNRVEKSVTGRELVSNALAAYWAFQGWGNNPDAFPQGFINNIVAHLKKMLDNHGREDTPPDKDFEDQIWQFRDWAFVTPTNPISVFLDNRTLRDRSEVMNYYTKLNDNKRFYAARLMNQTAYEKIKYLLKSVNYQSGAPIIFCAPTPVIGAQLFELGQIKLVDGSFNLDTVAAQFKPQEPGRYKQDYECWRANPRGKYDFLDFIDSIGPSKVIILSGDVHYAFHASVSLYSTRSNKYYEIEQLTSSAIKNNTMDKLEDIDLLARASRYDTKDGIYKKVNEVYPFPKTNDATRTPHTHLILKGKFGDNIALHKYSYIMDGDSWIIFHNNVGVVTISTVKAAVSVQNLFLFAESTVHMLYSFPTFP